MNLVHGRPDVVEKLNLDNRLHPAHSVADGASHNVGFSQRRIEYPLRSKLGLQAGRKLEDAAFALHFTERFLTAGVGHVLAIHHDAGVAAHLVVQAGIDQVGHGARAAALRPAGLSASGDTGSPGALRGENRTGGVELLGIDMIENSLDRRKRRLKGALGGLGGFAVQGLLQLVDLLLGQYAFAQQAHLQFCQRVAQRVSLTLSSGAIDLVVVGERVRVVPYAVSVDERRPQSRSAMRCRGLKRAQAGFGIRAVDFSKEEVREVGHQL